MSGCSSAMSPKHTLLALTLIVIGLILYQQQKTPTTPSNTPLVGTQNPYDTIPDMLEVLTNVKLASYENSQHPTSLQLDIALLISKNTSSLAQERWLGTYLAQLKELKQSNLRTCAIMAENPYNYLNKHSVSEVRALFSPNLQQQSLEALAFVASEQHKGGTYAISEEKFNELLAPVHTKYAHPPHRVEDQHRYYCNKEIDILQALLALPTDQKAGAIAKYLEYPVWRKVIVF
ncbi:MAG: hypothetical protein Q4C68_07465 [Moraxella sp.]|nr:hypothetical protein [Moraxella sp.]